MINRTCKLQQEIIFKPFKSHERKRFMFTGASVFSQIMQYLPRYHFDKCVRKYSGNSKIKYFTCAQQFYCMAFAQLTYRESLRDIETCLRAIGSKCYHLGITKPISKSTLADANEQRDWRIYADFAQHLIRIARDLYMDDPSPIGPELESTVYALDSTTIDLCISLFPWAKFRTTKSAVKMHTLYELCARVPTFIEITDGKVHDVNILDILPLEAGAFYVMDRGYIDYGRLYKMNLAHVFFVTRTKINSQLKRRYSSAITKEEWDAGVRSDQTVVLTSTIANEDYPAPIRRVRFLDLEKKKRFSFITNNFDISALTCAKLYKSRWSVELFFKWIKQHLRIQSFYGTSENAVKTQIWIAVSVYVLISIIRKRLEVESSLYEILQILSLTLLEKTPVNKEYFDQTYRNVEFNNCNQLNLFNL